MVMNFQQTVNRNEKKLTVSGKKRPKYLPLAVKDTTPLRPSLSRIFPSQYKPSRFRNANFSPYISPSKGPLKNISPGAYFRNFTVIWTKVRYFYCQNSASPRCHGISLKQTFHSSDKVLLFRDGKKPFQRPLLW